VPSAPVAVTVAGSQTEEERGNSVSSSISCFISSASFISSAWQDEVLQTLSLLALIGVFALLARSRRNKGASASGGLEEHPRGGYRSGASHL